MHYLLYLIGEFGNKLLDIDYLGQIYSLNEESSHQSHDSQQ